MNKGLGGLVASCCLASGLFLGGCGSKNEYHRVKMGDGTFSVKSIPSGEWNYKSVIEGRDKNGYIAFETLGSSLSSDEEFSITSIEITLANQKSEKVYADDKDFSNRFLPVWHYPHMFKKDQGRAYFNSGLIGTNYTALLNHFKECKGKYPCSVPRKK